MKLKYYVEYWTAYSNGGYLEDTKKNVLDIKLDKYSIDGGDLCKYSLNEPNHKVIIIDHDMVDIWETKVLGQKILYTNVYVEEYESIYTHFLVTKEMVYGLKSFNGIHQWKELNYYKFLENRVGSDEAKKLLDYIVESRDHKEDLVVNTQSLTVGYDTTNVHSCMKGKGHYFRAFTDYGKLVKFTLGGTNGRAILWNKDKINGLPNECEGFLDRIYPSDNHLFVTAVKRWASKNKIMVKKYQNYEAENKTKFIFNGRDIELSLTMDIDLTSEQCPYMDTFTYYDDSGYLHNDCDETYGFELTNTNGEYLDITCCHCAARVHNDDLNYIESYGDVCESCYSAIGCYCADTEDSRLLEDSYYCETDRYYYYYDSNLVKIDGKYYHIDDDNLGYCGICQDYFLTNRKDYGYTEDGYCVCDDCMDGYTYDEDSGYLKERE